MYDPSIGRWLQEDPLGFEAGDSNLYRYVKNNSQNKVDPTGLIELILVHATRPENFLSILQNGLAAGIDNLRWLVTPSGAGGGAPQDATAHLHYQLNITTPITDIPNDVIGQAERHAYRQVSDQNFPNAAARNRAWAQAKWAKISEWIHQQTGNIFRTPAPPPHSGYHYAFKDAGWKGARPRIFRLTGPGAQTAVQAAESSLQEANGASQAARARWGARFRIAGRIGGRVLIIVGVVYSIYDISTADNVPREITIQCVTWSGILPLLGRTFPRKFIDWVFSDGFADQP